MKSQTKKAPWPILIKPCCLSLLLLSMLFSVMVQAEVIDRVVAEVNDDIITLSDVDEEGATVYQKIIKDAPPEERESILMQTQQEVLNGLIDKSLITQEAAKQGVTVSDEELDAAIEQIIATNNITREVFLAQLQEDGLSEKVYRSNLRSQIYQNKLVSREVRSKIIITEDMILDFYDTKYTSQVNEGSYYLLQIGTSWEKGKENKSAEVLPEDRAEALKKAERIQKLAKSGQDFRDLARRFSDLPSARDGGDIGVFDEDEMADYMKSAVKSLKAGEISPIVETPVGYQFFMVLSNKEGGIVMRAPYDTVKEEIRDRLFREAMQKEFKDWIKGIRDRAYIRKL